MVQLGAYLAEPTASAEEQGPHTRSFLPSDPEACADFLAEECRQAVSLSNVATCMNLATPKLEWGLEAAKRFWQAGGEYIELNVHGGYGRYLEQGKLRAMVLPENQGELFRWVEAFTGLEIPLIVKFDGQSDRQSLFRVLDEMTKLAVPGVHVNVRNERTKKPDVDLVQRAKERYPGLLLVSGYVRSAVDARALFEAGADMVGIAEPAIKDLEYIRRIVEVFKAKYA
jgi:tRNA-dihydrouridine synthase